MLRGDDGGAEITLHQEDPAFDRRIDIADCGPNAMIRPDGWPPCFASAIIENSRGETSEVIRFRPQPVSGSYGDRKHVKD